MTTTGDSNTNVTGRPAIMKSTLLSSCLTRGVERAFRVLLLCFASVQLTLASIAAHANVPADANLFVITVDATIADVTAAGSFQIPSSNTDYQIYWEEVGNEAGNNSNGAIQVSSANHVINFGSAGIYRIGIDPINSTTVVDVPGPSDPDYNPLYVPPSPNDFDTFGTASVSDNLKLLRVEQWGTTAWSSMAAMFRGAENFTGFTNAGVPVMTNLTNISQMFFGAESLVDVDGMGLWDTSSVIHMSAMFLGAKAVNPDVANWDTSNVISFASMFNGAHVANPDVSNWDTSQVTSMQQMFQNAKVATPDTSNWDTSKVTSMHIMFAGATLANPDTSGWDTSSVTAMAYLFSSILRDQHGLDVPRS